MLFNLPAGDWAGGERGIAMLPDRIDEFRRGVDTAITYAKALGCEPGQLPRRHRAARRRSRRCCENVFVENLALRRQAI